ncbi:MAG: response regulator [Pseudomonadota bacterium]
MGQKKGRVLCVDDEPSILRSLQWLLQRDFEVMTAPGGPEGLELVRQHDFDVVVSDQRMPGMIGSEFLREVRRIAPRAMRILLTGYSDMQAILRSVNEGEVFRFINKPWSVQDLPRVVAEAAAIAQAHPVAAPLPEVEEAQALPADAGVDTILLVDDDPEVAELLRHLVGPEVKVVHARNLAQAVAALSDQDVGVLVSETQVGSVDVTRLLKLLKQQHPEIVTVVITEQKDADEVIGLINQGQIYRFIPKPIKPGLFKLVIASAALKRRQLARHPDFARRHAVEGIALDTQEELIKDLRQVAVEAGAGVAANEPVVPASFLQRVSGGLRRLFGV